MPPTNPLRQITTNNACPLRITAAAGTKLAGPSYSGTVIFFPDERALQPKGLLHSRGIAASEFPPLCKIPHCCLPQEFGPCLSPNVADHPLKSAIDHSLGRPLPHQQTNQVQAHPMVHKAFSVKTYPVLAQVSSCYSRPKGRYLHVTHPSATKYCYFVRLACVRRAASVRSEP